MEKLGGRPLQEVGQRTGEGRLPLESITLSGRPALRPMALFRRATALNSPSRASLFVGRDADTCVADFKFRIADCRLQIGRRLLLLRVFNLQSTICNLQSDSHDHLALFGELDGAGRGVGESTAVPELMGK